MKKNIIWFVTILLAGLLIFALIGCGGNTESTGYDESEMYEGDMEEEDTEEDEMEMMSDSLELDSEEEGDEEAPE